MTGWSIFFQLLGLAESEATNYYRLLGLPSRDCRAEQVDLAFHQRRQQLRQAIPGASFLPLLARFEKECLETAAAVLKDPARKAVYDRRLEAVPVIYSPQEIQAMRMAAIRMGHQKVSARLLPDGTLPLEHKLPLAAELRQLGFSPGDIEVLFSGLSRQRTAREEGPPATVTKETGWDDADEDVEGDKAKQKEVDGVALSSKKGTGLSPGRLMKWLLGTSIPLAFMALFLMFLQHLVRPPAPQRDATETPITRQEEPEVTAPPVTADAAPSVSKVKPVVPPASDEVEKTVPDEGTDLSPLLAGLRESYTFSDNAGYLLADLALTNLVMYEQIVRLVYDDLVFTDGASHILAANSRNERMSLLFRGDEFLPRTSSEPALILAEEVNYFESLKEKLESNEKAVVYQAIKELEIVNNDQAVSLLLETLKNTQTLRLSVNTRILRAMERMDHPRVQTDLINLLANAPPALIHPLTRTLARMNGFDENPPRDFAGLLPYRYNLNQLQECISWWQYYEMQRIRQTSYPQPSARPGRQSLLSVRSLAFSARLLQDSVRTLEQFSWEGRNAAAGFSVSPYNPGSTVSDPYEGMKDALKQMNDHLLRLARTHPRCGEFAAAIDIIECELRNRRLIADTVYKSMAGELDGINRLLVVIISQLNGDDAYAEKVDALGREFAPGVNKEFNLTGIRQRCFYGCRLWELFAGIHGNNGQ